MKNITKKTQTILFASLIAAMILPFSGMMMAEAAPNENANDKAKGKTMFKTEKLHADIPMFKEREDLLKQFNGLEKSSEKINMKKQLDAMSEKIQKWHDITFDEIKYKKAIDAKENLQEKLNLLTEGKGEKEAYDVLPWVSRSYDYTDNALEVRIDSNYYDEENVSKYIKTIRSLVGDEIDLTIGPGELVVPETCSSRSSSECNPIKGGVRFDADNENIGTVGFKASYNGKTGFVTAGHVFIDDDGDDLSGTTINQHPGSWWDIGNLENNNIEFGEDTWCDCAFVSELSSSRSMDDGVYGMSDPNSTENPYWNQLVAISGGYTGVSYGYVSNTNTDIWYDLDNNGFADTEVNDAIKAGYSSQGGDSGSPIISYSGKLVGIHIASNGHFMKHSAVTNSFPGLSWGF